MGEGAELAIILTAKDLASGVLGNVSAKFQGLGAAAKLAAAGAAVFATATVSLLGGLTKLAQDSASAAGEVAKLKRETGLTAEEASKLRVIGERLGLGTDELSMSFGKLSKSLVEHRDKFVEYGIKVVESSKGHVDFDKTLGNVADKFKGMPDGVEKSALAMDLFGKTGKDLIPFLNKGKDGLDELGAAAARMGLVFDDKALAAAKRYRDAQKDLGENIDGLKNKIGMAFLPVLADVTTAMVNIATAVLPPISAGFDKVTGFVRTAVGVFGDMKAALKFEQVGGGDFLASIIGPKAAADFMQRVSDVSAEWQTLWVFHIRPAIEWAEENIPKFWDAFKTAISNAWTIVKPKLDDFVERLESMKKRFDELPEPVRKWAEMTAASVVIVKATGLDDTIMGWTSAMGNFAQGGAAAWVIFAKAGVVAALTAAAAFAILLVAIGVVIFVGSHLDDLEQAWIALSGIIRLSFAQLADAIIYAIAITLKQVENAVNFAIDLVNPLWTLLGNPPIAHIHIDLPDADNVRKTLDDLARDRTVTISVGWQQRDQGLGSSPYYGGASASPPPPEGGSWTPPPFVPDVPVFASGGVMPWTGLAHLEAGERVIANGRGGPGGSQIVVNIGSVDSRERADEVAQAVYRAYRLAGGTV